MIAMPRLEHELYADAIASGPEAVVATLKAHGFATVMVGGVERLHPSTKIVRDQASGHLTFTQET